MTEKEQEFTNIIREHRSTIYSVCFMFAKCSDEADDLFQEVLIKLWHLSLLVIFQNCRVMIFQKLLHKIESTHLLPMS